MIETIETLLHNKFVLFCIAGIAVCALAGSILSLIAFIENRKII